jgi:hypothetical protein
LKNQNALSMSVIGAVTQPGDLVVDPAAGSFVVMQAALELGRNFVGGDLIVPESAGQVDGSKPVEERRKAPTAAQAELPF